MSCAFFIHAALFGNVQSSRTSMMKTSTFLSIFRCSTFLDAHILIICCASKKALRLILEENSRFHRVEE